MAYPHRDFEERTAEVREALAALRVEVGELQVHLQGAAAPASQGAGVEPEVGDASVEQAAEPRVGPRFDEEDVVPERLVTKSDAELAATFDIASSLLGDAEERHDVQAVAYWRSLAAAALEEARRRPEFGNASGASRFSPRRIVERRRRRLVAQLGEARERSAAREH
jgi:hypothetical protein